MTHSVDTSEHLVEKMQARALEHCRGSYCCSEAVFMTVLEFFPVEAMDPANFAGMAAGLCGGMGNQKATCGVFTGGALSLGLLARNADKDQKKLLRTVVGTYHDAMTRVAGGQLCDELLKKFGFVNKLTRHECHALTGKGVEILAKLILKYPQLQTGRAPR